MSKMFLFHLLTYSVLQGKKEMDEDIMEEVCGVVFREIMCTVGSVHFVT